MDALPGRGEEQLDDLTGEGQVPLGERTEQEAVEGRAGRAGPQALQVDAPEHAGTARADRHEGGRAHGIGVEQRQLAEHRSRTEDVDDEHVSQRARAAGDEEAPIDEVQGVRRVALVEHHLLAGELPFRRVAHHLRLLGGGEQIRERRRHRGGSTTLDAVDGSDSP